MTAKKSGSGRKWWFLAGAVLAAAGAGGAYWALAAKTYRVRIAADPGVRAREGWEARLRADVETASAIFAQDFRIRFKVVDVVPWSPINPAPRLDGRRIQLKEQVSSGDVDLVLGFTAIPEGPRRASVVPFARTLLVIDPPDGGRDQARRLAQALGYLMGAFRNKSSAGTLAGEQPTTDHFDAENTARIKAIRFYDLGKGLEGMTATDADKLAAALAPFPDDQGKPMGLAVVRTMLGASLMADGQTEQAAVQFQAAIAGNPNLIPARYSLAAVLADRRLYDEAAQALREAGKLRPRDSQIVESLAWVRLRQGRDAEAMALLRAVLRVQPESPVSRVILASLMAEPPGPPDPQLAEVRNLVRLNTEWAHPARAVQLAQGISLAAARVVGGTAPAAGAPAALRSGIMLSYAGKLAEAQRAFESALRQNPKLYVGHINLTLLNFAAGNLAAARKHAAASAAGGPANVKTFAAAMEKLMQADLKAPAATPAAK